MLSWGWFPRTCAPSQACTVWDIQVCLLGPSHHSPSCLQPPLHPVCVSGALLTQSQLLFPNLTGPPCRRGPVLSSFLAAELVFP